jgi:hypothetical protein
MAALACAFVVSLGGEVDAAEGHVEERSVVELTIAGTTDPQLEASLAELLGRAGFTARFERAARPSPAKAAASPGVVAVVALDLTRVESIGLVIVDARHATVLRRVVPAAEGLDEIAREEIGHIVLFSVEAIKRGEVVGSPEPQARERPPPKERARGELETVATLRTYANVVPALIGVGAAVGASTRVSSVRLRSLVAFEQRSAIVVETRAAAARFEQRSVRISMMAGVPLSSRVELTFAGGVAADLVAVTTTALRATTERRRDVADVVPVLDAAGGLSFELVPRLVVAGTIGVEVPFMTTEYALEADRDVVILAPDALRVVGRLSVGVSF